MKTPRTYLTFGGLLLACTLTNTCLGQYQPTGQDLGQAPATRAKRAWQIAASLLRFPQGRRYSQNPGTPPWSGNTSYPFQDEAYGYAAPMSTGPSAVPPPVSLRWIQSPRGEVGLRVPANWQVAPVAGQNLGAFSGRGESFSCGLLELFADYASMRNALQASAMMGKSQQELRFMQRLVSPQLSPDGVVARLFPQISGGAMQNVRILGGHPLPDGSAAIYYQYLLFPQRDALYQSLLPPVLQGVGQVPMQGEAHIRLVPGMTVGAVRTWSFLYAVVSAPTQVYATNARLYPVIFQSIQTSPGAVQQNMAREQNLANSIGANIKSQNQMLQAWSRRTADTQRKQLDEWTERNRKMGDIWTDMAGAQQRYIDPSHPDWASRTSVDNIPIGAQYQPYRCPAEDVTDSKIFWGDGTAKPYVDCIPLQQY
jgi:hypothetical protein